jgi:hypothetical protein
MSRTVAALYDSRTEAELARARLISEFRVRSPRIIAKDTAGAVDGLKIARADVERYREGLRRGGFLVVAEVPNGAPAKRVIKLLQDVVGAAPDESSNREWGDEQGVRVALPEDGEAEGRAASESTPAPEPVAEDEKVEEVTPAPTAVEPAPPAAEEERAPAREQVDLGTGARLRSVTREQPAEEQVALRDEHIEAESRPCDRQLTEDEVEAGGLFKERVIEIAEMREEPVVTKVAVVREEVIVSKRVTERVETIRDTIRHTDIEIGNLSSADDDLVSASGSGWSPLR